jgi:hypothetical protein
VSDAGSVAADVAGLGGEAAKLTWSLELMEKQLNFEMTTTFDDHDVMYECCVGDEPMDCPNSSSCVLFEVERKIL